VFEGNNNNMSDGEKKEKGAQQERKVPLLKLFSFADLYDYVLMGVGSVGACVHGASVPVFFVFFGKIINVVGLAYLSPKEASHEVAKVSFSFFYNISVSCIVHFPCTIGYVSSSSSLNFQLPNSSKITSLPLSNKAKLPSSHHNIQLLI